MHLSSNLLSNSNNIVDSISLPAYNNFEYEPSEVFIRVHADLEEAVEGLQRALTDAAPGHPNVLSLDAVQDWQTVRRRFYTDVKIVSEHADLIELWNFAYEVAVGDHHASKLFEVGVFAADGTRVEEADMV